MATKKSRSAGQGQLASLREEIIALRIENGLLRKSQGASLFATTWRATIRWVALVCIAWIGYLSITALAGKETTANVLLGVLANVQTSSAIAWILALLAILWGLGERKLRQRVIQRHEGSSREREEEHDQNRSSSNLTKTGDTPVGG